MPLIFQDLILVEVSDDLLFLFMPLTHVYYRSTFGSPQVIGRGRLSQGSPPGSTARCVGKRTGRGTGSAPQAGEQSERGPRPGPARAGTKAAAGRPVEGGNDRSEVAPGQSPGGWVGPKIANVVT